MTRVAGLEIIVDFAMWTFIIVAIIFVLILAGFFLRR